MLGNNQERNPISESPILMGRHVVKSSTASSRAFRRPLSEVSKNGPRYASPDVFKTYTSSLTEKVSLSVEASSATSASVKSNQEFHLSLLRCNENIENPSPFSGVKDMVDQDDFENIDPRNLHDLSEFWRSKHEAVNPYFWEIHANLISTEIKLQPLSLYLDVYVSVTPAMRATLVEWLSDVAHGCGHSPETLFSCVNYLDRYLGSTIVDVNYLQLVGITCLFMSSKLNDIKVPVISEYAYVAEYLYTTDHIIEYEKDILCKLEFNLLAPSALTFSEFYASYFGGVFLKHEVITFMRAICEYSLLDYVINNAYYPSVIGAAIFLLVSDHIGHQFTIEEFEIFELDFTALLACLYRLRGILQNLDSSDHQSSVQRLKRQWLPGTYVHTPLEGNTPETSPYIIS